MKNLSVWLAVLSTLLLWTNSALGQVRPRVTGYEAIAMRRAALNMSGMARTGAMTAGADSNIPYAVNCGPLRGDFIKFQNGYIIINTSAGTYVQPDLRTRRYSQIPPAMFVPGVQMPQMQIPLPKPQMPAGAPGLVAPIRHPSIRENIQPEKTSEPNSCLTGKTLEDLERQFQRQQVSEKEDRSPDPTHPVSIPNPQQQTRGAANAPIPVSPPASASVAHQATETSPDQDTQPLVPPPPSRLARFGRRVILPAATVLGATLLLAGAFLLIRR